MCQPRDQSNEAGSEGTVISPTNADELEDKNIRCSVQLITNSPPSWVELKVNEFNLPTDCGVCAGSLADQCSYVRIDVYPNQICDDNKSGYAWSAINQILLLTLISPEFKDSYTFNISYKGR